MGEIYNLLRVHKIQGGFLKPRRNIASNPSSVLTKCTYVGFDVVRSRSRLSFNVDVVALFDSFACLIELQMQYV